MLMRRRLFAIKTYLFFFVLFVLFSCNREPARISFPNQETAFTAPKTQPLFFTDSKPLKWKTKPFDSLPVRERKSFSLDTIANHPIDYGNFKNLPAAPKEFKIDFAHLPDTSFDLESIPKKKYQYQVSILPEPKKIKAGLPRLKDSAARSVFIYSEEQGIIGNQMQALLLDRTGMLWIATNMGITRFDGEYFENYDALGLDNTGRRNVVVKMYQDDKDRIWITTVGGGLVIIDLKNNQLLNLSVGQGLSGFISIGLAPDRKGRLWVCNIRGAVDIIDYTNQTIQTLNRSNGLRSDEPIIPMLDSSGRMWIGTNTGCLGIYSEQEKKIKYLCSEGQLKDVVGLAPIGIDRNGHVWASSQKSLCQIAEKEGLLSEYNYSGQFFDDGIYDMAQRDGWLWFAENGRGLTILNPATNQVKRLTASLGLGSNFVSSVIKDKKENIWAASSGGLLNIPSNTGIMSNLTTTEGLSSNAVWSIAEDHSGRIWLGTNGGLDLVDNKTNTVKHLGKLLNHPRTADKIVIQGPDSIWVGGNGLALMDLKNHQLTEYDGFHAAVRTNVLGMYKDSRNRIWASTIGKGVAILDMSNRTVSMLDSSNGLMSNRVWNVSEDKAGRMWVPTDKGLNMISADGKTVSTLLFGKAAGDKPVFFAAVDSDGMIWIAGLYGLYMINMDSSHFKTFATAEGLDAPDVYTILPYRGLIYIGTGKGLSVIRKPDQANSNWKIDSYGKGQGLGGLNFNSGAVLASSTGQLWWGIDQILTIMDPPREDSNLASPNVSSIDIMDEAVSFRDPGKSFTGLNKGDTLWTMNGDSFFIAGNSKLGEFKKKWDWDSTSGPYEMPNKLTLQHDQNFLKFYFTSNEYSHPDQKRYRYILEGIDRNWSAITPNPFTENYRDLAPGNYRFRVASKGLNGSWSNPAEFNLTILPPWWRTWWAYALYAVVIGAIARAILLMRSKALLRENTILESKVTQRTEQLRKSLENLKEAQSQLIQREKMASLGELTAGVAHEIQNPLNFVNNFTELNNELLADLKHEIEVGNLNEVQKIAGTIIANGEKITQHGKRADGIVKGMLQHSRTSSGQKEMTDVNALADEYLRLSYHGLRAKDKSFNAAIETHFDPRIPAIKAIPQDLGRVLLNIYNNAFYSVSEKLKQAGHEETGTNLNKYQPRVIVSTNLEDNMVAIRIRDNGPGVPPGVKEKIFQPFFTTKPAGQGTGLGLSLSYDIITKAHGGTIALNDGLEEGAEFVIRLPIRENV